VEEAAAAADCELRSPALPEEAVFGEEDCLASADAFADAN
jgi:hypothetical protein